METADYNNQIKEIVDTLLEKMGVSATVEVSENGDNAQFLIKTDDGGMLIGDGGKHLSALNYIVKRIADKTVFARDGDDKEKRYFSLDINDYQKQRSESLKEFARMNAQRVRYFKKPIELRPMNAYDRRVVHSTLTEYPDISTESVGEGEERRIIIKPYL